MSFKVIEAEHVQQDLEELMFFYERMEDGLGEKVLNEYKSILLVLEQTPHHHFNVSNKIRRILFKKFQCGVFYAINNNVVEIVGIKDMRIHTERFPH